MKLQGDWLLGAAASLKRDRESPGRGERLKLRSSYGDSTGYESRTILENGKPVTRTVFVEREVLPFVEGRLTNSFFYYPGVLFGHNLATDEAFQITTNQGDSEIPLIRDAEIYYRVNDELWRGTLASGKVREPARIAKAPEIIDAHWLFITAE